MGRHYCTYSLESNIRTSAKRHNWVIRRVHQGPGVYPLGRLNQPPLDDGPDVKLEPLGHGVQEDRLVLRNCAKMQGRLNFNT